MATNYQADPLYTSALAAYDNATALPNREALLASDAEFYSSFWNVHNAIQAITGAAMNGGTAITPEERAAYLNADGTLAPAARSTFSQFTAKLNAVVNAQGGGVVIENVDQVGPLTATQLPDGTVVVSHDPLPPSTAVEGEGFLDNILQMIDDAVASVAESINIDKKWIYVIGVAGVGYFVFGDSLFSGGGKRRR